MGRADSGHFGVAGAEVLEAGSKGPFQCIYQLRPSMVGEEEVQIVQDPVAKK